MAATKTWHEHKTGRGASEELAKRRHDAHSGHARPDAPGIGAHPGMPSDEDIYGTSHEATQPAPGTKAARGRIRLTVNVHRSAAQQRKDAARK